MDSLLLDVCCGPCASGVIPQLINKYNITLYFRSVNIAPKQEYDLRLGSVVKLSKHYDLPLIIDGTDYVEGHKQWLSYVKGHETAIEGGSRCTKCFEFRLNQIYDYFKTEQFDKFTTTLSVSPHKNAELINSIGSALSSQYLISDFKQNNGFLLSVQNSKKLGLYRQSYCGCEFSIND